MKVIVFLFIILFAIPCFAGDYLSLAIYHENLAIGYQTRADEYFTRCQHYKHIYDREGAEIACNKSEIYKDKAAFHAEIAQRYLNSEIILRRTNPNTFTGLDDFLTD